MSPALEPHTRRRRASFLLPSVRSANVFLLVAVAVCTFLLVYDSGGYSLSARATAAIAAYWCLLLGIGLRIWPGASITRGAWTVTALLTAFVVWVLASTSWAASAERAFVEFDRASLYLAIFLLALFAGTRSNITSWLDGFAAAVAGTTVISLVSRCFPSTFSRESFPASLAGLETRLSFPIGYWNGLGILIAFGFPMWLALAVRAEVWWSRALAVTPFPIFGAVLYLTSSRGAVAVAAIGALVFVLFSGRIWMALETSVVATAGCLAVVPVLQPRDHLVNGPFHTHDAAAEGHSAFLLILGIAVGIGALYAVVRALSAAVTPPAKLGRLVIVAAVLALATLVLTLHPAQRFAEFKKVPATNTSESVQSHLVSLSGSGRWQFWTAAIHEWESAPIVGRGAGSYEAWWARHASFPYFVRNAHSLYLEVLGEMGVIGFLLLVGALGLGGVLAVGNTLRRVGTERVVAAALLGVLAAFYMGAAIEWIWQLPAVAGIGIASLGLLVGPGTRTTELAIAKESGRGSPRIPSFAAGAAILIVAWVMICAEALPWLTQRQINASAAAVARDDPEAARRHALDARRLEPWAASPYLQLALVDERRGDLPAADTWIRRAIRRDRSDWRLWLVAARVETKRGNLALARKSLATARALNPRSPLLSDLGS
jgi:hypothetical protein